MLRERVATCWCGCRFKANNTSFIYLDASLGFSCSLRKGVVSDLQR
jgi:hypothetical protein